MMMENKRFIIHKKTFITDIKGELPSIYVENTGQIEKICDFLNNQEDTIKRLETENQHIVKAARESIVESNNEKNKLIYELWAKSVTPSPVVLGREECKTILDDYYDIE